MSLLIKKGKVIYSGEDWEPLEKYCTGKIKPTEVLLWPIMHSELGFVLITYSDKAMASFVGDTFSNLYHYLRNMKGWPMPEVYHKPADSVLLPFEAFMQSSNSKTQDKEESSVYVTRRTRNHPPRQEHRVRRSRAAN